MLCHILCPECGEGLGEVFMFYDAVKKQHHQKIMENAPKKINIDKVDLKEDVLGNLDYIFKALQINLQCCRMHIMSVADIDLI